MSYTIEQLDCAVRTTTAELRAALEESVNLQNHYAMLLNAHDGGERRTFTVKSWLARLKELRPAQTVKTESP